MSGIDLEDDLIPGETPATPTETKPKGSAAAAAAPAVDDGDADFGDEDQYRRAGELDILKAGEKNTFIRFAILTNPATGKAFLKKGFVHGVATKGYARCLSKRDAKGNILEKAACCKAGKDAKEGEVRYCALVVCYTSINPKDGKIHKDRPLEFELKALPLSRVGYKDISLLPGEDEDTGETRKVMDIDITGTPKDTTKGTNFTKISNKATWKRMPEVLAAVTDAMKPFLDGAELNRKIGRSLGLADMKAFMGITVGGGDEPSGMDDLD